MLTPNYKKGRFLPHSSRDYAIAERKLDNFTTGPKTLLVDIGRKMDVKMPLSEGRIPSPFSRAYVFFLNLYAKGLHVDKRTDADVRVDEGRKKLRIQARRTFRGICAAFAFREILDLDFQLHSYPILPNNGPIERVLTPAMGSAPGGKSYWNPLPLYTVRQKHLDTVEVIAGISPLTGFFPAAKRPSKLTALYWYDADKKIWYDPTDFDHLQAEGVNDSFPLRPETQNIVKDLLRTWIQQAINVLERPNALQAFGVQEGDRSSLAYEFKLWLGDVGPGQVNSDFIKERSIAANSPTANSKPDLPFLTHVCTQESPRYILSDLPIYDGKLLITRSQLLDQSIRIYGRQFGNQNYGPMIQQMEAYGDNLGVDIGLDVHEMPIGYVFVDRLFTHKLTTLTNKGLSAEWRGLQIDGEYFLYPFDPFILNLLSPEDLIKYTSGELSQDGENFIVRLSFGSDDVTRLYSISDQVMDGGYEPYIADSFTIEPEQFDIRVFPNFDIDHLAGTAGFLSEGGLNDSREGLYYARIRLAPNWDFNIKAFEYDTVSRQVNLAFGSPVKLGEHNEPARDSYFNKGQVLYIACLKKPAGFYLDDRGFCLLKLPAASGLPIDWEIGVDFGTSNTCIAFKTPADEDAKILHLPIFTTTLLEQPSYNARFEHPNGNEVNEGASAMLDFFYKFSPKDTTSKTLNEQPYFPTQFVTQYGQVQSTRSWEYEMGLIYFRNISLQSPVLLELVYDYPDLQSVTNKVQRRFRVEQNIKWQNDEWLEVFMRHLYQQIIITAAQQNATIKKVHFSYPKAFNITQQDRYQNVLRRVWKGSGQFSVVSESEAVRSYFVRQAGEYIVFDIGGGTSDIIAFSSQDPVYQTSFKLAAGLVNKYVVKSLLFRRAFLTAAKRTVGGRRSTSNSSSLSLQGLFEEKLGKQFIGVPSGVRVPPHVLETCWLGFLEAIERVDPEGDLLMDILNLLRDPQFQADAATKQSISGFFLTVTLLFSGLAFHAGAMLQVASKGGFKGIGKFDLSFIDILLTGNGSKLYRMVDHRRRPFATVIQKMLHEGMKGNAGVSIPDIGNIQFSGLAASSLDGREAPKESVALGLLKHANMSQTAPHMQPQQLDDNIPVANIVGEFDYMIAGIEAGGIGSNLGNPAARNKVPFEYELGEFYKKVYDDQRQLIIPDKPPTQLKRFLGALNDVLPAGSNGGVNVLPNMALKWADPLVNTLYPKSQRGIRTRLQENANTVASELQRLQNNHDLTALEPLFIVELAAFLEQIREQYAGGNKH